jgi:hypothetical protein
MKVLRYILEDQNVDRNVDSKDCAHEASDGNEDLIEN